ncbi:MAG TPA: hypothetical protein VGJ63_15140 [Micromonosporaceae bacterium]|jgi:hypothetical protein
MHGAASDPTPLVGFRWTRPQALARGLRLGGFGALVAGAIALAVGPPPLVWAAVVGAPLALGAAVGLARRRHLGADVDDSGIHQVPAAPHSFAPWHQIEDIRTERRRRRTVVSIYLASGAAVLMRAPYDGPLLAHDPLFEQKIFTLLNLWETHRTWSPHP